METTELDERLKGLSEEYRQDEDVIVEMYEEALEEVEERTLVDISDEEKQDYAFSLVRSDLIEKSSFGGGEEIDVLAIGHDTIQQWVDADDPNYDPNASRDENPKKDVLLANGILETDDGLGLASFILDETDGVDLGHAMELFSPLTAFRGVFSYSESENLQRGYIANSTADTEFHLEEAQNIPDSKEERLDIVHKFIDEVSLANVLEGLTITSSWEGGESPADFGIDIKRVEGNVVDYYVSEEDDTSSVYTILDSSVASGSELEGTPVDGENQRTTGLTCWTPTEFMEYGNGSRCEFYGTVVEDDDGRVTMNVRGIVPLMPRPMQDESTDENVERESI